MEPETNFIQTEEPKIVYGTFGLRLVAVLIDGLILVPFILLENFYNSPHLKSETLLTLIFILTLTYKPLTEYYFDATVGKMVLKLKVVNLQLNKPTLTEVLLRNIFHIIPIIIGFSVAFYLFAQPEFNGITTFKEYSVLQRQYLNLTYQIVSFALILTDTIFLLADTKRRALHDRIGQTFIIRKTNAS